MARTSMPFGSSVTVKPSDDWFILSAAACAARSAAVGSLVSDASVSTAAERLPLAAAGGCCWLLHLADAAGRLLLAG